MPLKAFIRRSLEMQGRDLCRNLDGLTPSELAWRPAPHSNSIGFLAWHMARVEDGWVQRVFQRKPHLWVSDGWATRFGMPEDMRDMGFGYKVEQMAAFQTPALKLLLQYGGAVRRATEYFLDAWDPNGPAVEGRAPWGGSITLADFFAQLLWELDQHGGQVAYLRGLQRGLQSPDYMGPLAPPRAT